MIGLNSTYKKWKFIVKEQGEGVTIDGKLLRGDIRGRGILAKPTSQDFCKRQPKDLHIEGWG